MRVVRRFSTKFDSDTLVEHLYHTNTNPDLAYTYIGDYVLRIRSGRVIKYWKFDFSEKGVITVNARVKDSDLILPVFFIAVTMLIISILGFKFNVIVAGILSLIFEELVVWFVEWWIPIKVLQGYVKKCLNKEGS